MILVAVFAYWMAVHDLASDWCRPVAGGLVSNFCGDLRYAAPWPAPASLPVWVDGRRVPVELLP